MRRKIVPIQTDQNYKHQLEPKKKGQTQPTPNYSKPQKKTLQTTPNHAKGSFPRTLSLSPNSKPRCPSKAVTLRCWPVACIRKLSWGFPPPPPGFWVRVLFRAPQAPDFSRHPPCCFFGRGGGLVFPINGKMEREMDFQGHPPPPNPFFRGWECMGRSAPFLPLWLSHLISCGPRIQKPVQLGACSAVMIPHTKGDRPFRFPTAES